MAVGVQVWSQTAASNSNADSNIAWPEGMAPSQVNDSARAMMSSVAKWRDDINATLTLGGSSTVYTLSTNQVEAALTVGYQISFTPNVNCGNTVTINVDSLGAKPLRSAPATELVSNQLVAGVPYVATYYSSNGGEWIVQGAPAQATGAQTIHVAKQIFTSNGTYTPTSGMQYALVEAVGGGGGGGGVAATTTGIASGGGGGGGAYARALLTAAQVGASKTVTIGGGGNGGASGNNAGVSGGQTSLGSLVIAAGGFAGGGAANQSAGAGGTGGNSGTGDVVINGATGGTGVRGTNTGVHLLSGYGGAAAWIGVQTQPASGGNSAVNGNNAGSYGAGGSGAYVDNFNSTAAGGNGFAGIVIITEYWFA